MEAVSNAQQRQLDFAVVTAQERRGILDTFARLQAIVARIQQNALADFDARVSAINKQLATELASLEVLANQAAAGAGGVQKQPESGFGNSVTAPRFVHVPLENVTSILEACWSSVTSELDETVSLDNAKTVVKQISKIHNIVQLSLKVANERERSEYATMICRSRSLGNHQMKLSATYPMNFTIGGLAVNYDVSMFALANYYDHQIVVYELPSGRNIVTFGSKGSDPGQFCHPLRLCFTPDGTLLVADSENKRLQEMTLHGYNIRCIQSDAITSKILHVTCNAEVIVATRESKKSWLCVFDMQTGNLIRKFGDAGTAPGKLLWFWDITLTSDGTALLVPDHKNKRISVFALDGTFLRAFGCVSVLESIWSVAELPSGEVVAAEAGQARLAIVKDKHELPIFVDAKSTSGPMLVRYANGYVFRSGQNFLEAFSILKPFAAM